MLVKQQKELITARTRALKSSELLYEITIDNLDAAIFVLDRDFSITLCNHALKKLCEKLRQPFPVSGKNIFSALPFLSPKIKNEYEIVFKSGKIMNSEEHLFLKNELIILEENKIPIINPRGGTDKIITVLRNITERKRNEEKIKASEANLNAIFENSDNLIFSVDNHLRFIKFNSTFRELIQRLFEYTPKPGDYIYENSSDERIRILRPLALRAMRGESFREEISMEINGREMFFEGNFTPIRQGGDISGFSAIVSNITQKKQMEKEAELRRNQLIQADKMVSLGILVAGVAHEINNPNNSVAMNVPLLERAWKSFEPILDKYYKENGDFSAAGLPYSEMRQLIPSLHKGIKGGAERIKNIVTGLKNYARQDSACPGTNIDINRVLDDALMILSSMIKKSTDNLSVTKQTHLPPVKASPQKVEQVFINLIQNSCAALKSPDDRIQIRTFSEQDNKYVCVCVEDEGHGISPEIINYVKDPFFTTKRDSGGTGLGLSISSGIVKDYNGKLVIESSPETGTKVTVKFPAAEKTQEGKHA
jgi:PAS domain S-box-containing protein